MGHAGAPNASKIRISVSCSRAAFRSLSASIAPDDLATARSVATVAPRVHNEFRRAGANDFPHHLPGHTQVSIWDFGDA